MKNPIRALIVSLGLIIVGLAVLRIMMKRAVSVEYVGSSTPAGGYGSVKYFQLTDQTGAAFGSDDLKGSTWIANFIFTRCMGPCPLITTKMSELQNQFATPVLRFISFSVDPTHDTPADLAKYAATYGADTARWRFLTGPMKEVYAVIRSNFHLVAEPNPTPAANGGDAIMHSLYFVLVGPDGRIQGYFDSADQDAWKNLKEKLSTLSTTGESRAWTRYLPAVNAGLNFVTFLFLSAGYYFIKKKKIRLHKACMITAASLAVVFLASYITYHYSAGLTRFVKTGPARVAYFSILISHTILAMAVIPFLLRTLYFAAKSNFESHAKIARWTWPIWMYVSFTGVVVYIMLYHWPGAR